MWLFSSDRVRSVLDRCRRLHPQQASKEVDSESTVLVSFFCGDVYYQRAADNLRRQCSELGLAHDIVEVTKGPYEDWSDICRKKIGFYRDMLHKHRRPILWVDVDSKLNRKPGLIGSPWFDLGLFLRNFKYLPAFDPVQSARLFHPGYIFFNYNERVLRFCDHAVELERQFEGKATDDYFLEEAVRSFDDPLRILLLSPSDVARNRLDDKPQAIFRHGDSGNVKEHQGQVLQHAARTLEVERQKPVLLEAAKAAAKRNERPQVIGFYERIRELDEDDVAAFAKLAELYEKEGQERKLQRLMTQALQRDGLRPFALRRLFIKAAGAGDVERSEQLLADLNATGHKASIDFAQSRRFRLELDRRAAAMGIDETRRPALWWWEQPYPGNLGDILNPYLVEKLSGIPPRYVPAGNGILAIGSVIKFAKTGTQVWGTGSPNQREALAPDADYRAVRGPHTRELVLRSGGVCPEIYGDAAWFLPRVYAPTVRKTHRTGLILHHTHAGAVPPVEDDVRQISIIRCGYAGIETFLDEMLSCERIISTSLHGVIIANAYGIPALWATVSQSTHQIHGDGIKFRDYFETVDFPQHEAFDLSGVKRISGDLDAQFLRPGQGIDLDRLASVAPFPVLR